MQVTRDDETDGVPCRGTDFTQGKNKGLKGQGACLDFTMAEESFWGKSESLAWESLVVFQLTGHILCPRQRELPPSSLPGVPEM